MRLIKKLYIYIKKIIKLYVSELKKKRKEEEEINSKFLRVKTKILTEKQFNKLLKKSPINYAGSNTTPVLYKGSKHFYRKRHNTKLSNKNNGFKLK